ncbi:GFA family protein [uncultured Sulfitobacter sp.]|uniref:GFA family protein n=1 Tax=uncultured Sulfitobacter sp. TaxID=191468 RepID=UPI00260D8D97|nr:GFA family protein [uncultured Sulfitobacter sp.]
MKHEIKGECMCGAVKVSATTSDPALRACHCEMCRRQNSYAFVSLQADQESIRITGPVTVLKSSDWAQRAFCSKCGSTIWYGLQEDGHRNLSAGLFPKTGTALMTEYFTDECLLGNGFPGDHEKLTRNETFALFAPSEGDAK